MNIDLKPTAEIDTFSAPADGTPWRTAITRPDGLQHERRSALFVYDPRQTGMADQYRIHDKIPADPTFVLSARNARSIGQRLIATDDGTILLDRYIADEREAASQMQTFCDRGSSLFHEDTDVALAEDASHFHSGRLDQIDIDVDRPVLSLLSAEPSNYGSWLFRILPKLETARTAGIECSKVVCWSPRDWQKELLRTCGFADDDIIEINLGATYRFNEIYVPALRNSQAYLSPSTLDFYRETLSSHAISQYRQKRLYVSRQSYAARHNYRGVRWFMNEDELVEKLRELDFIIVEPESMSVQDQIRLFASAGIVVGPSGAGMFNTIFMQPGSTVIDIEAFPHWLYAHSNLFASCHHHYGFAVGLPDPYDEVRPHQRWTLDIAGFVKLIRHLLAVME